MKVKIKFLALIAAIIILFSCKEKKEKVFNNNEIDNSPKQISFSIVKTYSHNINSFTEGLFIDNEIVYESTGSPDDLPNTKSVMGILNLESGLIDEKVVLDKDIFFGEGITKCKNKIYQLTYKNKTGFIYDSKTFKKIDSFKFENDEGWGLTTVNDTTLIMSDGSNNLTFLDARNLKPFKKLAVFEKNIARTNLNELEYVNGYVYANIYTTGKIVKIDINSGLVVAEVDLSLLCGEALNKFSGSLEMNGIAYNVKKNTFLITGKMWPNIYEIKLME